MEVLGLIGIRSGSKGVKNKNIKLLYGKPLVGWVLEAAKKSKSITRLVVSTDSEEYANIAIKFGAEVPCLRPTEMATDNSPEIDYVTYTLDWLKRNENYSPDIVIRLMATVPLQESGDIDALVDILKGDPLASSAVVISESRQHPIKALKIIDDGFGSSKLVSYFSESGRDVTPIARQNYEKAYFRANVIACRTETVYDTKSLTGDLVRYHIIPQERAIDIDNLVDFSIAELLLKNKCESENK
jgi:CMP-N,N'-diacetyllegionaminic acid synthase